jgi:hypothetical protein
MAQMRVMLSRGMRWLLLLVLVIPALAGCGGGSTTTATSTPEPTAAEQKATAAAEAARASTEAHEAAVARHTEKVKAAREAAAKKLEANIGEGLGATKAKFESSHDMTEPSQPTPGVAFYKILGTNSAGRVTGYEVHIPAEPPYGDREKLVLLDGIDLPKDSPIVAETSTCIDWRLRRCGR